MTGPTDLTAAATEAATVPTMHTGLKKRAAAAAKTRSAQQQRSQKRTDAWFRFLRLYGSRIMLSLPVLAVGAYFVGWTIHLLLSIPGESVFIGLILLASIAGQIYAALCFFTELRKDGKRHVFWNDTWLVEFVNAGAVAIFTLVFHGRLILENWLWSYFNVLIAAGAVLGAYRVARVALSDKKRKSRASLGILSAFVVLFTLGGIAISIGYSTTSSASSDPGTHHAAPAAGSANAPATLPAAAESNGPALKTGSTKHFDVQLLGACPGPYELTITGKGPRSQSYRVNVNGDRHFAEGAVDAGNVGHANVPQGAYGVILKDGTASADLSPECP